jgi:hypothetical protein
MKTAAEASNNPHNPTRRVAGRHTDGIAGIGATGPKEVCRPLSETRGRRYWQYFLATSGLGRLNPVHAG